MIPTWTFGPFTVPVHGVFVALGVTAATIVFALEARRRGAVNEQSLVAVTGALVGGAIGMRLSGLAEHLDVRFNPTIAEAWQYGSKSILGGLAGAYFGVLVAKKMAGITVKTGDLFAPAVALGMAIGRVGCHLTEAPGRPTSLPWGIHASATTPECPGCLTGQAMHPSFIYEIVFQLVAFVVLMRIRKRITHPGELFILYLASYAAFRFLVEFFRANETVWLDLTRPQWVLMPGLILLGLRVRYGYRNGFYDPIINREKVRA